MVPAPGIYLGAVARATKRIHLGPLVYLLPLSSPLRLIEEICMLDHLSRGRLEVGVGRGVSPFELGYHHVDHADSRDIFIDAFHCVSAGLAHDTFSYGGKYFTYTDVPMPMRPLQQPHPPFWYGSSNTVGRGLGGRARDAFRRQRPDRVRPRSISTPSRRRSPSAAGRDAQARILQRHGDRHPAPHRRRRDRRGRAAASPSRRSSYHLAASTGCARCTARPGATSRLNVRRGTNFEECVDDGMAIAGTPDTVRREIERQAAELGVNYLLTYLFFGTLGVADASVRWPSSAAR